MMMFNEQPKNARSIVYEAAFIYQNLGAKLKAKCGAIK
jgi:hypothetical protein